MKKLPLIIPAHNKTRGEVLCFADADMGLDPETFNAVSATLDRSDVVGGTTGGHLERWSVEIAVTYASSVSSASPKSGPSSRHASSISTGIGISWARSWPGFPSFKSEAR